MKSQSQLVLTLKAQIAATLKLIALKIKRYVLQLLELEQKLEVAMSEQLVTLKGSEKQIAWAEKIKNEKFEAMQKIADPVIQEKLHKIKAFLDTKPSAKWWIENKENPAVAFFIYGLNKINGENKIKYNTIQYSKIDGVVNSEKTIPTTLSLGDLSKIKNPSKVVESLQIERTYSNTGDITYTSKKEDFVNGDYSDIIHPKKLLSSGWAVNPECLVIRLFESTDRVSGDDVACWVFVKE